MTKTKLYGEGNAEDNSFTVFLLCCYIFMVYARPQDLFNVLAPLHLPQLILITLLITAFFSNQLKGLKLNDRITKAVIALLLSMIASLITSIWRAKSIEIITDYSKIVLTCIFVVSCINNKRRYGNLINTIICANLLLSVVQIYVYLFLGISRCAGHGGYGLRFSELAGCSSEYTYGVGGYVYGFMANAADLGIGMLVLLPFGYYYFFLSKSRKKKFFYAGALFSFFISIIFSGSRGAFLGLVAMVVTILVKSKKLVMGSIAIFVVFLISFMFAPNEYVGRILSISDYEQDESANIRLELWGAGLKMFADNPIFGMGAGNFPTAYGTQYHSDQLEGGILWWNPHNIFIHILSEMGIFGIVSYCCIILFTFKSNKETRRSIAEDNPNSSFAKHTSNALDAALIGLVVSGCFNTVTYFPHLYYIAALSSSLNKIYVNKENMP